MWSFIILVGWDYNDCLSETCIKTNEWICVMPLSYVWSIAWKLLCAYTSGQGYVSVIYCYNNSKLVIY